MKMVLTKKQYSSGECGERKEESFLLQVSEVAYKQRNLIMKINRLLTLLTVACVPAAASAQTVLSDFSDMATQVSDSAFSTFTGTWSDPSDQFTQNSGFITIEPIFDRES